MNTLKVQLGERSYPIYIDSGVLSDSARLNRHIKGRQVLVISNTTVAPLLMDRVCASLDPSLKVSQVLLPDGEEHKTLGVLEQIFDKALEDNHNRSTTFLALGGGVVGDMAGFAAASYQRGVNFLQIPTTLLAQVDSSVGGKTGVNHPLGKNMIGAFYQPQAVFIDPDVLDSLPDREYAAGLAEVIKYGLICDPAFYEWLQHHRDDFVARDKAVLSEAIKRSCAAKARVVAEDEREGGVRAILNLGHTFGHAIEAAQGYGSWLHGEAVSAGMVLAARLSVNQGWITDAEVARLVQWLEAMSLPTSPPKDMSAATWTEHMLRDKKVVDGRLRLVLLAQIGEARIVDDLPRSELEAFMATFSSA
ncbi:MAG: 3-dehydroquinate synthase [Glaciecola sp.]|jgi:3-dehydroquinate synthase|uniref:3-dehydroquinate synthase n=1 Tax=Congregibacter sp. TaxID=2744308 RepID=UPI0039E29F81